MVRPTSFEMWAGVKFHYPLRALHMLIHVHLSQFMLQNSYIDHYAIAPGSYILQEKC